MASRYLGSSTQMPLSTAAISDLQEICGLQALSRTRKVVWGTMASQKCLCQWDCPWIWQSSTLGLTKDWEWSLGDDNPRKWTLSNGAPWAWGDLLLDYQSRRLLRPPSPGSNPLLKHCPGSSTPNFALCHTVGYLQFSQGYKRGWGAYVCPAMK